MVANIHQLSTISGCCLLLIGINYMTTDSGSSLPQLPRFLSTAAHHKHHDVFDETHKPLFPLSYDSDVPGLVLAILGLLVAAGGGIGGGGILVPIYILVLNFSPKHAIPLSNVTVLGGSIANNLLNARKRHPEADRPLIDWDLVLVMEPLTIAGALIGAILNKVLPEQLLATLLVLLLSATGYTTLSKAKKLYKKETLQMLRSPNNGELESELTRIHRDIEDNMVVPPTNVKRGIYSEEEKESDNNKNKNNNASADSSSADSASQSPESDSPDSDDDMYYAGNEKTSLLSPNEKAENKILEDKRLVAILEEEKEVQMSKIIILVVMFSLVLIINILKGGGGFASPLGIKCGSKSFWIANIIILAWIIAVSNHCRELLLKKFRNKKVSERSERASLEEDRAMDLAKWLQTATSATKLTQFKKKLLRTFFARRRSAATGTSRGTSFGTRAPRSGTRSCAAWRVSSPACLGWGVES